MDPTSGEGKLADSVEPFDGRIRKLADPGGPAEGELADAHAREPADSKESADGQRSIVADWGYIDWSNKTRGRVRLLYESFIFSSFIT